MPFLIIQVVNSEFQSRDDGADYESTDAALAAGMRGAVATVSDEVLQGRSSAAVEISVIRKDGMRALRSIVSLSVAPVLP